MKFGKRLGAEAERGWQGAFLDYKACKRAISKDVILEDLQGTAFEIVIRGQLKTINTFFTEKVEELKAVMASVQPGMLAAVRAEVLVLRKYSILNATAVIKAVKKRNKHLGKAVGPSVRNVNATQLLSQQYFFASDEVAKLLTQAEIMAQEACTSTDVARALEDYECPICLAVLENPVTLSCAHRFCWGCLLSHCATCQDVPSEAQPGPSKPEKPGERLLTAMLGVASTISTYPCPVCRKAHPLDLDRLQVDGRLAAFITDLKRRRLHPSNSAGSQQKPPPGSAQSTVVLESTPAAAETIQLRLSQAPPKSTKDLPKKTQSGALAQEALQDELLTEQEVEAEEASQGSTPPLLPPQTEEMKGRLTVVLDLDGTLISSFAPRRAPSFSKSCNSYIVGRGAKLNPNGVLVVERPELGHFLQELYKFAEVVLFTAGLEDYASPICTRLQDQFGQFQATLYRPATVAAKEYPCVKDLSHLGRDLKKTVLVDDTPLAFLHQPDNGIPIYSFRGDEDDRVLPEAILPLLQQLAGCEDVRPVLHRRFNMPHWMLSHGITTVAKRADAKPPKSPTTTGKAVKQQAASIVRKPEPATEEPISETLILTDFDKTLTDCDAGETVVGELAPELVPMLASLQQPANFVPLTNAVMREVARRGVGNDRLESTLEQMGTQIPQASKELLQWAQARGIDVRVISDCNALFISHMLKGAGVESLVKQVITNPALYEASMRSDSAQDLTAVGASKASMRESSESSQHLVITPKHCSETEGAHHCPICPANLCKGLELRKLRKQKPYQRIIYCGDGANDLCPAQQLQQQDVVLARKGYDLDRLILESQQKDPNAMSATVHRWGSHGELLQLLQMVV